jgi:hypothetical protein
MTDLRLDPQRPGAPASAAAGWAGLGAGPAADREQAGTGNTGTEAGRAAIEAYLAQFPGGLHEADAKIALEAIRLAEEAAVRARREQERQDDEAWQAAAAQRTSAAVDAYLSAWPGGLRAAEARALRQELAELDNDRRAFEAARKLNTVAGYQSYVDAFPRGASVAGALEAIDELTLRPGKTFRDCPQCPTMIVVPAGSFWQGAEESASGALKNETPRRMVTIAEPFVGASRSPSSNGTCARPTAAAPPARRTMVGADRGRPSWCPGTMPRSTRLAERRPGNPTTCPARASGIRRAGEGALAGWRPGAALRPRQRRGQRVRPALAARRVRDPPPSQRCRSAPAAERLRPV